MKKNIPFKNKLLFRHLKSIHSFLDAGEKRTLIWLLLGTCTSSLMELFFVLGLPVFLKFLFDGSGPDQEYVLLTWQLDFNLISAFLLIVVVIRLCLDLLVNRSSGSFFSTLYSHKIEQFNLGYLQLDYLSFKKINRNTALKNTLIITRDVVFGIQRFFQSVKNGFLVVVMGGALLIYDSRTTLLIVPVLLLVVLVVVLNKRPLREAGVKSDQVFETLQIQVSESLNGFKSLKFNNQLRQYAVSLSAGLTRYYREKLKLATLPNLPKIYIESAIYLVTVVVIWLNHHRMNSAGSVLPSVVFYFMVIRRVIPTVNELLLFYLEFIGALFGIESLNRQKRFFKARSESQVHQVRDFQFKSLELNGIGFCYENQQALLDEIRIQVLKGEHLAVLGPSGAGKSTLVEIMASLIPPTRGEIRMNGEQIVDLKGFRDFIGFLPQSYYLNEGSILNNIVGFDPGYDHAKLNQCLEVTRVTEFLPGLVDGLNTNVGDQGQLLSGGQRQRIALASVLYSQPQLLILDEATSALDFENEDLIISNVFDQYPEITIVAVTHHDSLVQKFDRVVYIAQGAIAFSGSPEAFFEFKRQI